MQLAFFHPHFEWAPLPLSPLPLSATHVQPPPSQSLPHAAQAAGKGEEEKMDQQQQQQRDFDDDHNAALHFEKRAPFPTINLLRARQIRAAANQVSNLCNLLLLIFDALCCSTIAISGRISHYIYRSHTFLRSRRC